MSARRADPLGRGPVRLDGVDLKLLGIALDGAPLDADRYRLDPGGLTLLDPPSEFVLQTEVEVRPRENRGRTGLLEVGGQLMTQCEPEGFRRLTFFPDRPDVLSRYTVTLRADPAHYPVLLSNGDLVENVEEADGRRRVVFHDPHPKPSYIFAVVAGELSVIRDGFVTGEGREVGLAIYADKDLIGRCGFAMEVLKRALAWDETVYGLSYDLDSFALAAITGWSGAMENKGLNLFGASGVIADPAIATDDDYIIIERIVAHEMFHNWTGNRVTCRDWFQLCLKEGLTRFRDQQFIEDRLGDGVWRIEGVRALRRNQFPEDDGPAAHPIQPRAFAEIENFYTNTVYDKGAEIFRMLRALLGPETFRAAFDLYIARNDGRAATIEDFIRASEEASGRDLVQFRRWITTAGRPRVRVSGRYDPQTHRYELEFEQQPPGGEPFLIPIRAGLIGPAGEALTFRTADGGAPVTETVIALDTLRRRVTLEAVAAPPAPSLLRGFSAPITLLSDLAPTALARLMTADTDPFARWDAGQTLAVQTIRGLAADHAAGRPLAPDTSVLEAYGAIITETGAPALLRAFMLMVPDEPVLGEGLPQIDLDGLMAARDTLRAAIGTRFGPELLALYHACCESGPYSPDPQGIGRRKLKSAALELLTATGSEDAAELCLAQLKTAANMTDGFEALALIAHLGGPQREEGLAWFYDRWRDHPTVIDKWFNAQALSRAPGAVDRIIALEGHPACDPSNFARGLVFYGGFFRQNRVAFHDPSGKGYEFLAERLLALDRMGRSGSTYLMPQINQWRRYDTNRRDRMKAALERVAATPGLSKGLRENVSRALNTGEPDA